MKMSILHRRPRGTAESEAVSFYIDFANGVTKWAFRRRKNV